MGHLKKVIKQGIELGWKHWLKPPPVNLNINKEMLCLNNFRFYSVDDQFQSDGLPKLVLIKESGSVGV